MVSVGRLIMEWTDLSLQGILICLAWLSIKELKMIQLERNFSTCRPQVGGNCQRKTNVIFAINTR